MNVIKKIFITVLLLVSFAYTGYSFYLNSLRPCDREIKYAVGIFDDRFGITKEDFQTAISTAESVWEKALAKELFVYDPSANFKINLVYDERQISTVQRQRAEFGLSAAESVLKKMDEDLARIKDSYEKEINLHQNLVSTFEAREKKYLAQVDYWNARGGAPNDEYLSLQKESISLTAQAKDLNARAFDLNLKAKEINDLLARRNESANQYNKITQAYNQKYGQGIEFNQAEYTLNEINIYQFGSKEDLKLALVHELGHALGMEHTDDPESIMYYITNSDSKNDKSLKLSTADLDELKRVCQK